jgi:hypothetical protein
MISLLTQESDPILLPNYLMTDVLTRWSLETWHRNYLSNYYILHWKTPYFQSKPSPDRITHDGLEYLILLHKCNHEQLDAAEEIALSFRKLKNFSYGYVLVRPL